jgi:hypothetical protein
VKIILSIFQNLSRVFKLHYNLTRTKDTLHEDRYTFLIIPRSVLLRMKNVSDKRCRENRNMHFMFSNFYFTKIASFIRGCENIVEPDRLQMTIWRMRNIQGVLGGMCQTSGGCSLC